MDLIVNSLYSNREVFLRELISNCSDALDKIRFLGVTDNSAFKTGEDLEIRIQADPVAHTITITDTGVGMTRDEVLSSLGTIARSGTAKFAAAVKEAKGDANLIGQFGVGFYSSFLVASRVTVETKSNEDPTQWAWESTYGSNEFKLREDTGEKLSRGTRITLHLKEDAHDLADDKKLASLVKQYSEFISFPIKLWSSSQDFKQVPDEAATAKKQAEADEKAKADGKEAGEKVEPVTKSESETKWDWTIQNDNKPLWTRRPREISKDEYDAFYKTTFKEFMEPCAHSHFNVEGQIEFTGLLYVPGMAPFDQQNMGERSRNIRLFVKRVFISDEFDEDLLPRYLSFIKGVVDSADLPLNVSREILQESRVTRQIRRSLIRRSIDMLTDLASKEPEADKEADPSGMPAGDYMSFWESFGKMIKLGCIEDQDNKTKLADLLRFSSSKSGDTLISFKDYVGRMKEGQKGIYWLAADNKTAAASAPFVEGLAKRDLEVLFLTDAIDEVAFQNLSKYGEHNLVDVSREQVDLGDSAETAEKTKQAEEALKGLTSFMKDTLGERVEKVTVSQRLAESPCALISSQFGYSANMERIMRSQTMGDNKSMEYMRSRRTLEINPEHPIIQGLNSQLSSGASNAKATAELLYETALITSGFSVDSPKNFGSRIYDLMASSLGSSNGKSSGSSSSSSSSDATAVEAEVMQDGSADPWRQ